MTSTTNLICYLYWKFQESYSGQFFFLGQNGCRGKHDPLVTKNVINYPSHTFSFTYLEIFFTSSYFNTQREMIQSFWKHQRNKKLLPICNLQLCPDQLGKVKGANAFTKYGNGHTEGDILNPQSQIIISSGDG